MSGSKMFVMKVGEKLGTQIASIKNQLENIEIMHNLAVSNSGTDDTVDVSIANAVAPIIETITGVAAIDVYYNGAVAADTYTSTSAFVTGGISAVTVDVTNLLVGKNTGNNDVAAWSSTATPPVAPTGGWDATTNKFSIVSTSLDEFLSGLDDITSQLKQELLKRQAIFSSIVG